MALTPKNILIVSIIAVIAIAAAKRMPVVSDLLI